jgi:hypothetical protein
MRRPALPVRFTAALAGVAFSIASCGSDSPETPEEIASGTGTAAVIVALAGVSLSGDCPAPGPTAKLAACASTAPNCNCRQSAMQLKVSAKAAQRTVSLAINQVRIVDPASGRRLGILMARMPQKYDGTSYVDWDQQIAPNDDFNASYLLSAPDWSTISPSGIDTTTSYRIEVDLSIGGEPRTIKLDGVKREVPIAT